MKTTKIKAANRSALLIIFKNSIFLLISRPHQQNPKIFVENSKYLDNTMIYTYPCCRIRYYYIRQNRAKLSNKYWIIWNLSPQRAVMKVAGFNVNSLRARLPIVLGWLEKHQPDVLALQETKVQDIDFPDEAFEKTGYEYAFKGQKSYNGVAIFAKSKVEDVQCGFENDPKDASRLITAEINGVAVVNTYVPQGYLPESEKFDYKLEWFDRLLSFFERNFKPTDPVIWLGDFNIAPSPIDVYDPDALLGHVCYHPEVHKALDKVLRWGFVDVFRMHCKNAEQYTFWDYRARGSVRRNLGWRLDHIMATRPLAEKSTASYIDKEPRLAERPSDHTPIVAEFDWPPPSKTDD